MVDPTTTRSSPGPGAETPSKQDLGHANPFPAHTYPARQGERAAPGPKRECGSSALGVASQTKLDIEVLQPSRRGGTAYPEHAFGRVDHVDREV